MPIYSPKTSLCNRRQFVEIAALASGALLLGSTLKAESAKTDPTPKPRNTRSKGPYAYLRDGEAIRERSFDIVRRETDLTRFSHEEADVAVRIMYACGSVDFAPHIVFSPTWIEAAKGALGRGAPIFCDSLMVSHGINRHYFSANNEVICTLNDPRTPALARQIDNTRSAGAMELWRERLGGSIVAIGNAPTALFHLLEMLDDGAALPAAVIGLPVGFTNVVEAKEALIHDGRIPFITVRGRQGGSAMCAAAINALAHLSNRTKP